MNTKKVKSQILILFAIFLIINLFFLFLPSHLLADDLCYGDPYSDGFFLFPRSVLPIQHINNGSKLTNVTIEYAIDGFDPSDPLTSKIGIDNYPKSPEKDNPDKYKCSFAEKLLGCQDHTDAIYRADEESTFDPFGMEIFNDAPITFWNHGISYNLGDMSNKDQHNVWTKKFIAEEIFSWFFSKTRVYASYYKNGKRYHVVLNPCNNGSNGKHRR